MHLLFFLRLPYHLSTFNNTFLHFFSRISFMGLLKSWWIYDFLMIIFFNLLFSIIFIWIFLLFLFSFLSTPCRVRNFTNCWWCLFWINFISWKSISRITMLTLHCLILLFVFIAITFISLWSFTNFSLYLRIICITLISFTLSCIRSISLKWFKYYFIWT